MNYQFKFGDIVQDSEGKRFVFLRSYISCCTVASEGGETYDYLLNRIYPCKAEPHPDTSRLDWLFEKDHQLRSRWCKDEHDNLRDAIDAAMKETN